ncbi:MAG: gamma-glutamylcyclotransferase family protein [bacterium]
MPWYFAYGSNMQTATLSGRRGVEYRRALPARVPGWRLVLDKPPLLSSRSGFANIIADPQMAVLGVLYELSVDGLEHVELTEGVLIGNYAAVDVQAWPLAGDAPVLARSLSANARDASLRPSLRYMRLLIEGALEHGLPADYVDSLRAIPTLEEDDTERATRTLIDAGLRAIRPRRSE